MAKTDKKTKEKKVQKATVAKAARSVNPVPVTSKEILAKARTELPGKQKVAKPSKKSAPKSTSESSDSDSESEEDAKPKSNGKANDQSSDESSESSSEDEPSKASQVKAPKNLASSSDSSSSESESDGDAAAGKLSKVKSTTQSTKTKTISAAKTSSSSSDDSSESESDTVKAVNKKAKHVVATTKKANTSDSSDTSDSESDSEKSKPIVKAPNGTTKAAEDSGSESDSDSDTEKDADTVAAAKKAASSSSEESESDSSGSEDSDNDVEMGDARKPAVKPTANGKRKAVDEEQPEAKKVKLDPATPETLSIFVGQLSWSVDNDRLAQEFSECGEVSSATVQLDRNTGRSRGFGYVHFSTADAVEKALKMNGYEIDGRAIKVDLSTPPNSNQIRERRAKVFNDEISPPSSTLFIGNLPFSITEDGLWSYFDGHSVKTIRLPTDRETGQLKGFGYVELENVEDAKKAFEAISGQEIEGRRVRVDYSQPRDSFGGDRGARGGRGGGRGRGGDRGGRGGFNDRGGRGGFGDRGGRGGRGRGRGAPRGNPRSGGIMASEGKKITF
ncbi:hypothetical protein AGABI2DRAFT_142473 [Agaricus bisporus var. bisporus H97]|uniref:hypothetical protein n=1 Tax=Agaricus bisporus var. bisporus (strain H97 / ATCC MYA-4626 / FGSC 10389) TaxID=936046 RepID=UPI00029F64B1|nr:hypothetical protein AGABI2DRAFT_142473 [Agaricus bisporus var. bisporus H97]EKV48293.1 hypothetical protein AGABI2DRAFT_142473 [Agaricus bisporus var. bisporus H97]